MSANVKQVLAILKTQLLYVLKNVFMNCLFYLELFVLKLMMHMIDTLDDEKLSFVVKNRGKFDFTFHRVFAVDFLIIDNINKIFI